MGDLLMGVNYPPKIYVGTQPVLKIYQGTTQVYPRGSVVLPPADHLVIKYFWEASAGIDLDTATEFIDSGLVPPLINVLDFRPAGYYMNNWNGTDNPNYPIINILHYAGDNVTTGDETVYINISELTKPAYYDILPAECTVNLRGNWYESKETGQITMEIRAYSGGTMYREGFNYLNTGGVLVSLSSIDAIVDTYNHIRCQQFRDPVYGYSFLGQIKINKSTKVCSFNIQ